tara:strand:- start:303 stop:446 length:144 start_codon:yes stop_codon:yes gene_type:complete
MALVDAWPLAHLFLNPLGIIFDSYRHIEKVMNPNAYIFLKDSLHFLK